MNEELQKIQTIETRLQELYVKRRELLSLPPEKALEYILDEPQAAALVHSFPEEDFYFLIHDIGIEDSLELLYLASPRQWEYILDAEVWEKDRIDIHSVTLWLNFLMKADPQRLIRWAAGEKKEFIEYYLFRNIQTIVREHDQDPGDLGDDFFTDDEYFYVRFLDTAFDPDKDNILQEQRDEFLLEFLRRLSAHDHIEYQNMLLESASIIPAEFEEESYRLRNVSLAEKGFLPFEESLGIYQPLKPQDIKHYARKNKIRKSSDEVHLPVPLYSSTMVEKDNLFAHALEIITMSSELQELQTEFAALCNQLIAADQKKIRERKELGYIVKKVCGYISTGLEVLAGENKKNTAYAASLIRQFPLCHIFRVGYGKPLELKWKAEKWRSRSWFEKQELPLTFWGEEWLGLLGGLLIKKPLFFDNYETGVLYREFYSLEDISRTEKVLNEIIHMDKIFSLMETAPARLPGRFLSWKNMILTLWVRYCLNLPERVIPVEMNLFKKFYQDLWEGNGTEIRIGDFMKSSFLEWLSGKTGMDKMDIAEKSGESLENLFNEIQSEYGSVSDKNLNPKYVHLFLLA